MFLPPCLSLFLPLSLFLAATLPVDTLADDPMAGPGIRVVASKETIYEVRGVLDLVVTEQLRAALPVDLGPFQQKVGLSTLYVKDSILRKTSHTGTGVTLDAGHGFTLKLLNFGCEIWADVAFSLFKSKGTIEVSQADVEMWFEVHSSPDGSFTTVISKLEVSDGFKITPNFPGASGIFFEAITALSKSIVKKELPLKLPPLVNQIAAQIIAGFQFEMPIGNDLLFDARLPRDIVFTNDDVTFYLVGELHPNPNTTGIHDRCPFKPADNFPTGRGMLEVDVDQFVLDCAAWAAYRKQVAFEKDLGAVGLRASISSSPEVSLWDGGGILKLPVRVDVLQHPGPGTPPARRGGGGGDGSDPVYVGVYANVSLNTSVTAIPDHVGPDRLVLDEFVTTNLSNVNFSFGIAEFGPDVPQRDREEALATDWSVFQGFADRLLVPVVRKIDAVLKTFPVQVSIPGVELNELSVTNTDDYVRVVSQFKFNDTEIRTWNITELLAHPFEYLPLPNVTAIEEQVKHILEEIFHALVPSAVAHVRELQSLRDPSQRSPAGGLLASVLAGGNPGAVDVSTMAMYATRDTVTGGRGGDIVSKPTSNGGIECGDGGSVQGSGIDNGVHVLEEESVAAGGGAMGGAHRAAPNGKNSPVTVLSVMGATIAAAIAALAFGIALIKAEGEQQEQQQQQQQQVGESGVMLADAPPPSEGSATVVDR